MTYSEKRRMVNNLSIKLRRDLQEMAKRYGYDIEMETSDIISVELPPPKPPIVVNLIPTAKIVEPEAVEIEVEEPEEPKVTPETTSTPPPKRRKRVTRKKLVPTEELEPDMKTFAKRISEKLASTEGLPPDGVERALKVQKEIQTDLRDVFLGKKDYNQWFDRTKTKFGLHPYTFTTILVKCLEGLQSIDAQALRADYQGSLSRLGM